MHDCTYLRFHILEDASYAVVRSYRMSFHVLGGLYLSEALKELVLLLLFNKEMISLTQSLEMFAGYIKNLLS